MHAREGTPAFVSLSWWYCRKYVGKNLNTLKIVLQYFYNTYQYGKGTLRQHKTDRRSINPSIFFLSCKLTR